MLPPGELRAWLALFLFDGPRGGAAEAASGWTPLRLAAMQDNAPVVEALLAELRRAGGPTKAWLEAPLTKVP